MVHPTPQECQNKTKLCTPQDKGTRYEEDSVVINGNG